VVLVTLLYSGAFALLTAAVYTWVGLKVGRPGLEPDELRAVRMFKLWWHSLAALTYVSAAFLLLGAFGTIDLAIFVSLLYVELGVICLAFWGLAYYLAFLFTGKRGWFVPLGIFYTAFLVLLFYLIVKSQPIGVTTERWQVSIKYAHENLLGTGASLVFLFLFLGPQVIGAIAYFTLYFRTDDPWARYRIGMVSLSLLAWFGSSIAAGLLGASQDESWMLASRVISLAAALVILMAYRPPAWVRRRLGSPAGPATPG
jgi:hypothetical protein